MGNVVASSKYSLIQYFTKPVTSLKGEDEFLIIEIFFIILVLGIGGIGRYVLFYLNYND